MDLVIQTSLVQICSEYLPSTPSTSASNLLICFYNSSDAEDKPNGSLLKRHFPTSGTRKNPLTTFSLSLDKPTQSLIPPLDLDTITSEVHHSVDSLTGSITLFAYICSNSY